LIDARAVISPTAIIHDDVSVGPFSVIGDEVEIGSGTRVGPHVVIKGPSRIGRDNRIYQFAAIGDDPQDKKYAGERTRLTIGNGNTIREYVTINRGTIQDRGETLIGDDNWIMAYVHIAHDCVVGNHTIFANGATLAGHVTIGDHVILAGYSGVHQFGRVGPHAFLGMYAGVSKDVPAYVMVMGYPPAPRGVNSEGLKRRGFTPQQIRNIREAYRVIYRQGLKLAEAVEELTSRVVEQPELAPMLDTLRDSERSILR
jgi:UDP-N-acetylglucosamine acyltransferase